MNTEQFIIELSKKIDMMASIFSKYQFNEDAKLLYVKSLIKFKENPFLFRAIDELSTGRKWPYVQDIIDHMRSLAKKNPHVIESDRRISGRTDSEPDDRKNDLMSILWLYYSKVYSRYELEVNLSGNVILDTFRRMFPDEQFSIDKLELEFPKERVESWMNHQRQVNP